MRRIVGILSALSVVVAGFAVASPAHAVTNTNLAVVCNFGGVAAVTPTSSITGAVANDTVSVSATGGNTNLSVSMSGVTGAASITNAQEVYTIASASPAYITFTVVASGGSPSCNGDVVTLSINGGTPDGSSSAATSSGPAPLVQQFGRPASGTCDIAAPVILNWGGAESGGWGESWAEWVNGGLGGPVCTRTLVYSSGLGRWAAQ